MNIASDGTELWKPNGVRLDYRDYDEAIRLLPRSPTTSMESLIARATDISKLSRAETLRILTQLVKS